MSFLGRTVRVLCLTVLLGGLACAGRGRGPDFPESFSFRYLSEFGRPGDGPGMFWDPGGISVDPLGAVYIADTGNHRIQRLDPDGRFVSQMGRFGWGPEDLNGPTDVCARSALRIYIADAGNRRLQILDHGLNVVSSLPRGGEGGASGLNTFVSVVGTAGGHVYVVDGENDRVLGLDPDGIVDRTFGGFGGGDERLRRPTDLAIGRRGEVFVCDSGNHRIVRFDAFGTFREAFGEQALLEPEGLDVSEEGAIFVADTGHDRVLVFHRSGREVAQLGGPGRGPGAFERPRDLAVWKDVLYVLDSGNGRVQRFRIERGYAVEYKR